MRHAITVLSLVLILGCTTTQPPATDAQATPAASGAKNLKVLPHDMTREQLLATMRSFTRGLGVRCNHCHVVTATTPEEVLDFPSDAKEEKRAARVMIQMAQQINTEWLKRADEAEGHATAEASAEPASAEPRVSCWTCHRGKTEPEMPPPPPPRPAR
jgi:predicted trehalose synthase